MPQLIQTKCPALVIFFVCSVPLLWGCQEKSGLSPAGYDLNNPVSMEMGKVLNEISGLSYVLEDSSLVAISDNQEKIINIKVSDRKLTDKTGKVVAPGSDLEDVVLVDGMYYILLSRGIIKEVPPGAQDSSQVKNYEIPLTTGPNDFETLYHDPIKNSLIMICKSCAHEEGKGISTAFRFDLSTKQFDSIPFFTISHEAVQDTMKDMDAKVAPSAAAIHPVNNHLYILSSAGNLLIICDQKGKVLESYKLHPDKYPQAEGIAFAPSGNMFISNEGKLGKATLLFFPYRLNSKKN